MLRRRGLQATDTAEPAPALKKMTIKRVPRVLVLHLSRFSHDQSGARSRSIHDGPAFQAGVGSRGTVLFLLCLQPGYGTSDPLSTARILTWSLCHQAPLVHRLDAIGHRNNALRPAGVLRSQSLHCAVHTRSSAHPGILQGPARTAVRCVSRWSCTWRESG